MAVLPILRWPDPRLATVCDPVTQGEDLSSLIEQMFQTMYDAPGRGLAAPQVGVTKRFFVMDVTWKEGAKTPVAMINPRILDRSDEIVAGEEGCLSIPGVLTAIERPARVEMEWTDAQGDVQRRWLDGFAARCAQHEYDHLDGVVTFDRLAPVARAEAIRRFEDMAQA
ncbi:peptide deformylase [Antarcticimicrobium luteum]|uniref:Peptide deformylase n=1 Tax=Antarcticimicrobium luteum TaxID=2547397 RepID=A0A4R5V4S3_9RHOB|nr:peptide deformylase [Antarcticimicrobium luteum]TDK46741.1 peptide deformylase [Antarcticimicrobium luteum]